MNNLFFKINYFSYFLFQMHGKSFLAKATLADTIEELLLPVPQDIQAIGIIDL